MDVQKIYSRRGKVVNLGMLFSLKKSETEETSRAFLAQAEKNIKDGVMRVVELVKIEEKKQAVSGCRGNYLFRLADGQLYGAKHLVRLLEAWFDKYNQIVYVDYENCPIKGKARRDEFKARLRTAKKEWIAERKERNLPIPD